MDDELITETKWWKNWKYILPLSAMALIGIGILLVIFQIGDIRSKRKNGIAFEKEKWSKRTNVGYLNRNSMLSDLLAGDTLKKLNRLQIYALLGPPDRVDNDYLFYRISQEQFGFLILHATTLVIKLNDTTENKVMIHE